MAERDKETIFRSQLDITSCTSTLFPTFRPDSEKLLLNVIDLLSKNDGTSEETGRIFEEDYTFVIRRELLKAQNK